MKENILSSVMYRKLKLGDFQTRKYYILILRTCHVFVDKEMPRCCMYV